jgi:glycosyltransferase involved in cell wall biosynthesis
VRFLGHRPDVERVFAAMDIFVLSSVSEGLSNTILEAMASGLPVVATAVGGADELVVDGVTGLLVPPRSAEALASAIYQLSVDSSRRYFMAEAGRQRALNDFSIDRMLQNYMTLYESVGQAV